MGSKGWVSWGTKLENRKTKLDGLKDVFVAALGEEDVVLRQAQDLRSASKGGGFPWAGFERTPKTLDELLHGTDVRAACSTGSLRFGISPVGSRCPSTLLRVYDTHARKAAQLAFLAGWGSGLHRVSVASREKRGQEAGDVWLSDRVNSE